MKQISSFRSGFGKVIFVNYKHASVYNHSTTLPMYCLYHQFFFTFLEAAHGVNLVVSYWWPYINWHDAADRIK